MVNVCVLKAPHHLDDGVHVADMTKELITEAFPGTCPFHQTGNVHELNRGRHNFF
jgi:hypothetical protein